MPLDTLLDLPTKEKLATDTLDLVADSDFELDLRVVIGNDLNKRVPDIHAWNTTSYFYPCTVPGGGATCSPTACQ